MQKKKLTVRHIAYLALYVALYLVLKFVGNMIPFLRMPNGGSIELELAVLFVCSYQMGWKYGLVNALLSWLVSILAGFGLYVVHPAQLLLDYVFPLSVCGLASLLGPYRKGERRSALLSGAVLAAVSFLTILFVYGRTSMMYVAAAIGGILVFGFVYMYAGKKSPFGIIAAMVLKYFLQACSGAYFWFPEGEAAGSAAAWLFSLGYNLWYNVATMIVCVVLVPLLVDALRKAKISGA